MSFRRSLPSVSGLRTQSSGSIAQIESSRDGVFNYAAGKSPAISMRTDSNHAFSVAFGLLKEETEAKAQLDKIENPTEEEKGAQLKAKYRVEIMVRLATTNNNGMVDLGKLKKEILAQADGDVTTFREAVDEIVEKLIRPDFELMRIQPQRIFMANKADLHAGVLEMIDEIRAKIAVYQNPPKVRQEEEIEVDLTDADLEEVGPESFKEVKLLIMDIEMAILKALAEPNPGREANLDEIEKQFLGRAGFDLKLYYRTWKNLFDKMKKHAAKRPKI